MNFPLGFCFFMYIAKKFQKKKIIKQSHKFHNLLNNINQMWAPNPKTFDLSQFIHYILTLKNKISKNLWFQMNKENKDGPNLLTSNKSKLWLLFSFHTPRYPTFAWMPLLTFKTIFPPFPCSALVISPDSHWIRKPVKGHTW